jgi:hypothetical protein
MNSEADGGNATLSEVYIQAYSSREALALAQSRQLDCAPSSAAIYRIKPVSGINSDLSEIFLFGVVGVCRTTILLKLSKSPQSGAA